jgi:RNA polymerase sigma-70 factor, ECF subfamily
MSLHHRLPDQIVRAPPQTLLYRECSQRIRLGLAAPVLEDGETGSDECVSDHPETIDADRQNVDRTTLKPSMRDALFAAVPGLRAFAMSLSGNADRADDLVQETLVRAIANINSFRPGTNMAAWLFTILRNHFRSEYRKRRREVEDTDGGYLDSLKSLPEQHGRLEFKELFTALAKLPLVQREALLLVGASGFSYDEAAAICGTAIGTIKSRTNRGRALLAELLGIDRTERFGPDPAFQGAIGHLSWSYGHDGKSRSF